jgi:DNA-binding MarR family transcriptional regulator
MDKIDLVINQWHCEKPHLDTRPMALIGRLLRLSKHLENSIAECHKEFGLTFGEFDVLATLRRSANFQSLTPSELLNALLLTSGAMTNRLDKLQCKGLINRNNNKQDKRSVAVSLTAEGRKLIDEVIEAHVRVQHTLVGALDDQDKLLLNGSLKIWLAGFESTE